MQYHVVVVSALALINKVNQCRARLVLRWVPYVGSNPGARQLSQYVTSHPGQLSLAIPSWVGAMSTSQRAVTPCGWELRQVWFVYGWQVKLRDPLVTHGAISEHFRDKELIYKAVYKFSCLLHFTF